MNKKVALHKLRSAISNGEQLAQFNYVERIGGKECYCAVGHLMKECGINIKFIAERPELNEMIIDADGMELIARTMEHNGFTLAELKTIQSLNDDEDYEELTEYIDNLLIPLG